MAMFTGTFPHENSAYRNVPDYGTDFPLKGDPSNLSLGGVHEDLPTWIEILKNQGRWDPKGGLTGDGHANNVDADLIEVPDCYPDVAPMGTHVPWIMAGPGIRKQLRIRAPVSHLDLLPTLLEILRLPPRPALNGSSLMPILRGEAKVIPDRSTIKTSCHERYEGRAVCDGSYYYIRNLRKITMSSLDRPQRGLNADQYSYRPGDYGDPSGPWFNRSYSAIVSAIDSPQRKLLSDFLSGTVPDEELFDLEKDPWCLQNLADDPVHDARKLQLRKELERWRRVSNDHPQAADRRVRRAR